MKKILVFLFAVLALGGCGSGDIENMLVDEPRLETFRGVVESQDDFDEYSGTHLLRMEDEVLPLRSLSLNLSNKKYLGANVEVMGVYVEDEAVFEVTGISVKRAVEESDSVGMVEFVSENLGLKINYYSDWELDENGNLLTFRAPSLDGSFADQIEISMSPYDFVSELEDPENDLADPLEAYFAETFSSMSNYQNYKHVLGPDRLNAVKIGDSYHIYRSAYVYNISFVESADQTIPENKKIFNEMLNSFRFLPVDGELDNLSDSAETAQVEPLEENEERSDSNPGSQVPVALDNMTYFESLPYKFSAAYPNGWYYAGSRGSSGGILHHYAISDEPIEDVDGIISLDIVGDGVPGSALPYREYGDLVVYKSSGFGDVSFYAELGGHTYHVYGPLEYSETVELITLSITSTE